MTVSLQIPYNTRLGNGSITLFSFTFGLIDNTDLLVLVDQVLQSESSDYTVVPASINAPSLAFVKGGDIIFTNPPSAGAEALMMRKTAITQQLDYTASAFPSETHEEQLDKLIFILQELINGVIDGNLTFDLSTVQGETTVTVVNSGGTDAVLPTWVSGLLAGVAQGEITTSAPADGAATTKPDGYTYYEVA